jgi:hypothetical protein
MPQQRITTSHTRAKHRKLQILTVLGLAVAIGAVAIGMSLSGGNTDDSAATLSGRPAGSDTAWTSETYTGGPRLVADQTDINYGAVDYNQQVEAIYRLKNIGDEVVTIDEPDIKTLEGC